MTQAMIIGMHKMQLEQFLLPIREISTTIQLLLYTTTNNQVLKHDRHIERVWKLAKEIAIKEGVQDTEIVELSALLHDIRDWKYSGRYLRTYEPFSDLFITAKQQAQKLRLSSQHLKGMWVLYSCVCCLLFVQCYRIGVTMISLY